MPVVPPVPEPKTDPGAFDPKAYADSLFERFSTELNKGINAIDKKFKDFSKQPPAGDPNPVVPPVADPNPQEPPKEAKTVAEMNAMFSSMKREHEALKKEYEQEKKAKEEATKKGMETERLRAFDGFIEEIPFADAKARETFRRANLGSLIRDEEGNFIVETPQGPMSPGEFYKTEAQSLPGLLQKVGHSGAGANGGTKSFGGQKIDFSTMSVADIQKLPREVRDAGLSQHLSLMNEGN